VCGTVLDSKTPLTIPRKSDMFDYDLRTDCKIKEKHIDMRKVYMEKLKEVAKDD
jgi:hypothetical protein